jgi:hypothetical protein
MLLMVEPKSQHALGSYGALGFELNYCSGSAGQIFRKPSVTLKEVTIKDSCGIFFVPPAWVTPPILRHCLYSSLFSRHGLHPFP